MDTAVQTPRRKPVAKTVLQMLGGMVIGGLFGVAIGVFAKDALPDLDLGVAGKLGMAAALVIAFPLLVGVHELGHLLGGIAVGFRPLLFMVGPLRIERIGDRVKTSFTFKNAMFGGLAACVPMDTRDLRRRMMWMIAGGPLGSLAAGALLLAAGALAADAPVAKTLLFVFGFVSLLIGAIALMPAQAQGFYSDGARIIRLIRGGADVEREVAVLAIMGASMSGQRPRDWNPQLIAAASAGEPDTLFGAAARQYAYQFEMDRGRVDAARVHLEAALSATEILPKQARPGLMLLAAYFAARVDGDTERARSFLARAEGGLLTPGHTRPLVEAAIARAEGDRALAAERLDAAEAALHKATDAGAALAALRREIA
jgi:hypothetical protein